MAKSRVAGDDEDVDGDDRAVTSTRLLLLEDSLDGGANAPTPGSNKMDITSLQRSMVDDMKATNMMNPFETITRESSRQSFLFLLKEHQHNQRKQAVREVIFDFFDWNILHVSTSLFGAHAVLKADPCADVGKS